MRRLTLAAIFGALVAMAIAAPAFSDDKVTGQTFVRHDGGSDAAIGAPGSECNDDSTDPTSAEASGGDSDPNDGASRRQGNEPYSVVDPTDPDTIVAGWNDYCLTDLNAGWEGFAFSRNGGETWTNSLVPGYPQDTSAEGQASPIYGIRFAGDPIAAFDNDGRLYVGGIAFNRAGAINGSVWVATYGAQDQANGYPVDYLRTRVVGKGTPSRNFQGIFQDKPMLEVDRTAGPHDGNVYVCWARFQGFGENKIFFSRSTDMGETFSRPVALSDKFFAQGCDIAVEADGDVYVTWRTFDEAATIATERLVFVRSTDGGKTFSKPQTIREIKAYFPFDGSRDCGDGPFECPSEFVFHRVPLEPRVTSDQTGALGGIYVTYNAIRPGSEAPSGTSYESAGDGQVGQSLVYVIRSLDDGQSWSSPAAVDAAPKGHQFFPDIDALEGKLAVVWQDNRADPAYSIQLPIGNTAARTSSGDEVVNTFFATSTNGTSFGPSQKVSDVGNQSQHEMFGNRDIPFYGDYNWISLVNAGDDVVAYMTWTDDRDVVSGTDPRETTQDGFDVLQCREEQDDGTFGPDTCPNAGGLDQNIYGASRTVR